MRGRRGYAERLSLALRLLEDPRFGVLPGPALPFADLPERLPALLAPQAEGLCPVVTYI
jgi:hypothetical protein